MNDIYKNNLSDKILMMKAISKSNKPRNKYNESMHQDTEALTGEPNDRTGYDCGMEREIKN